MISNVLHPPLLAGSHTEGSVSGGERFGNLFGGRGNSDAEACDVCPPQ